MQRSETSDPFQKTVKSVIEHAPGQYIYLRTQFFIRVIRAHTKQFKMSFQAFFFLLFFSG